MDLDRVNRLTGAGEGEETPATLVLKGQISRREAAAYVMSEALLSLACELSERRGAPQGWGVALAEEVDAAIKSFVEANTDLVRRAVTPGVTS